MCKTKMERSQRGIVCKKNDKLAIYSQDWIFKTKEHKDGLQADGRVGQETVLSSKKYNIKHCCRDTDSAIGL